MCATQAAHMTGTHFMSNKASVYVTGSDISSKLWLRVCLLNYTTETPGFVITCPTILPREKNMYLMLDFILIKFTVFSSSLVLDPSGRAA